LQGIGIDLVENHRIGRLIELYGSKFLSRIYTERELLYCAPKANSVQCFAARFAAKEAFMKAVGMGLGEVRFKDVEVVNLETGQPELILHGRAYSLVGQRKVMVSLSHTDCCSVAVVVIF